jgi:hypothetical protein
VEKKTPASVKAIRTNQPGRSSRGNKIRFTARAWKQLKPNAQLKMFVEIRIKLPGSTNINTNNPKTAYPHSTLKYTTLILRGSSRRNMGLAVQNTSTQRRMTPSALLAMLGANTRKPQNRVMNQKKCPKPLLSACSVTCARTPSAVMPAAVQVSATVPRGRKATDNMLGSASPMKQAGIQMTN